MELILISGVSERLPKITGAAAPKTMPAHFAPLNCSQDFPMILPASILGKISRSTSPAILLSIPLCSAACLSKATSKAMGPSAVQGGSSPYFTISTSAAASTVEMTFGSTISLAVRIATLGFSNPRFFMAFKALRMITFFCSRSGATLMPLSEQ